jgi:hypothetical protein
MNAISVIVQQTAHITTSTCKDIEAHKLGINVLPVRLLGRFLKHVRVYVVHDLGPELVHLVLHPLHLGVEPLPDVVKLCVHDGEVAAADGHTAPAVLGRRHDNCDAR